MHLEAIDLTIVAIYAVVLLVIAQWVSREDRGHRKNADDYFLAGRKLPWWAIGASLIAANISAEQIIGMSGSAFVMGIAIASYEWLAAVTLLVVGKYLLPVFLDRGIYTMPQFLEQRFDHRVKIVLAVFWLGVYVFVNLTSILWLGALAINSITGLDLPLSIVVLAAFATAYSLYGGLKAVALTDIIQVVLLVLGGLMIAWVSMNEVSGGNGALEGFRLVLERAPDKFDMILSADNPSYASLPGISVLIGGMWVMHFSYWGFNQYIIQRALGAESLQEAQKGIVFAASLKVVMPIIVVLPGIAAIVLVPDLAAPDQAYPEIMKLLPAGLTGLVFAALIAAIVSSLASMMNSISTIFTMDVYRQFMADDTAPTRLVTIGRIVSLTAIVIAAAVARPLLGNFDQAFQYIQEFTGFFTPGVVAIFMLAIFSRTATANGALAAATGSAALSLAFKLLWPSLPFIDRVGLVFLFCLAVGMAVSRAGSPGKHPRAIDYAATDTRTSLAFNLSSATIIVLLAAIYAIWW